MADGWQNANGRRRRVYRLTRAGHRALQGKTREWTAFSSAVSRVIGATQWTEPA